MYGDNSTGQDVIRDELDRRIRAVGRIVVTNSRSSVDIDLDSGAVNRDQD